MKDGTAIGWGLIGASNIAREYMVKAINAQPDSYVAAVMSSKLERAQNFAGDYNIPKAYNTLDDILHDPEIDAVYISTTNERHKAETIAAAQAGKHVLCEKPLALYLDEAKEMVNACRKAGVVMGTNHHLRNAVTHRTLRHFISEGRIGVPLAARVFHAVYLPPFLQTWRTSRPEVGGGVILDITVHDADTLRFVLNDEVEEVMAFTAQQGMANSNLADAVMGVIRFRRGTLAQFHDAFTIAHTGTGMQIHGTEGSLIAEDVMTQQPIGRIFLQRHDYREEIRLEPAEDLYIHAVRHFNQAIHGNGQPFATSEDGIYSLAIALAVQKSAQAGTKVSVPSI